MKNQIYVFVIIAVSLIQIACGSNKLVSRTKESESSNRWDLFNSGSYEPKSFAECTHFRHRTQTFEAELSLTYDRNRISGDWVYVEDELRLGIIRYPSSLTSSSNTVSLSAVGFTASSSSKNYADLELQILIEVPTYNGGAGVVLNRAEPLSEISYSSLKQIIDDYNLNTTVPNLLTEAVFILKGLEGKFKGITFFVKENNDDAKTVMSIDSLVPPFIREISIFEKDSGGLLTSLHPNASSSQAHSDFQSSICDRF